MVHVLGLRRGQQHVASASSGHVLLARMDSTAAQQSYPPVHRYVHTSVGQDVDFLILVQGYCFMHCNII